MSKRSQRFRKATSERSGFDTKRIVLIDDEGVLVDPGEFDMPPPSKKPLGGEGEVSGSPRNNSDFADGVDALTTQAGHENPVIFVTAADGITAAPGTDPMTHPFMRVTGSNTAVNISADPQISRGRESEVLTLQCIDSGITLDHGTGLNMLGSAGFVMESGDIITFIYTTGGTVWNETSRSRRL